MKFNSYLVEATLLKRYLRFLVEVELQNKRKLTIRCPNLGKLLGCDVLGTRIWYSNAQGFNCLPTWELAEIDGGHLVAINPEVLRPIFKEALHSGVIKELSGYKFLKNDKSYEIEKSPLIALEKKGKICYTALEHVTFSKDNQALFPEVKSQGDEILKKLIKVIQEGHRAVLCYCITNTAPKFLKPAINIDPEYKEKIKNAIDHGVELIAYKSVITINGIELALPVPILTSENVNH